MSEIWKGPLFDGRRLWENAAVTIENGMITAVTALEGKSDNTCLLMPGLIDAHTHISTPDHINAMLRSGITAACDVSASKELVANSGQLRIISSAGMAMGMVLSGKSYVEKAVTNGARYVKVLLFNSISIGKTALCSIVNAAHEKGLKVAVHATKLATVRQAVEAGADILLHVPMKEPFPKALADTIAAKGIAVAPTLVMMEAFANSGQFGYKKSDYANAETAVKILKEQGVTILAATDANPGSYAPAVAFGSSIHREMELLVRAGLIPLEVLRAVTDKNAEIFAVKGAGTIAAGMPANMMLIEGRPDKVITDSSKIVQIWVNGKTLY